MDELNRRNTETVKQTIKDLTEKVYAQQTILNEQNNTIKTLGNKVDELARTVNMLRAVVTGTGPTSR